MGKFGCRLYCWGCGGCCIISGIVMGILATLVPPGMLSSIQESVFDLAYIDDTSQTEAEGLFADAGAPLAEADSFKAWGKTIAEGYTDCMKADFAFDWAKSSDDCLSSIPLHYMLFNATNTNTWVQGGVQLEVQEVGPLILSADVRMIEPDTAYWDDTGKVRYRNVDLYSNSPACDQLCEEFIAENAVVTLNIWYGILADIYCADGWVVALALETLSEGTTLNPTLAKYLDSTASYPMDPHSMLPFPTRVVARLFDLVPFLMFPAQTLGTIQVLDDSDYSSVRTFLWDLGGKVLSDKAAQYGAGPKASPLFVTASAGAVLGWGAMPVWIDPLSQAMFTFNFAGGASGGIVTNGPAPSAYIEVKMSSAYYHEGLGYVTQHYESGASSTAHNHSCAWDPDCNPAGCFETANCFPESVWGWNGVRIPGRYFGSPKGQDGFASFAMFVPTYYMQFQVKRTGRAIITVKYKGPGAPEDSWNFEGFLAHTTFKASHQRRRLENCNYASTAGRDLGNGVKDSVGQDCNSVKDTLGLKSYLGIPVFFRPLPRNFATPGWDSELSNLEDGPNSITSQEQVRLIACTGKHCVEEKSPAFYNPFSAGYEPVLGVMIDLNFLGSFHWKFTPTPRHGPLATRGFQMIPLLWANKFLHLPDAINVDLSKLQLVPQALNGFYFFLLGQCMTSLLGGFACCFCGV